MIQIFQDYSILFRINNCERVATAKYYVSFRANNAKTVLFNKCDAHITASTGNDPRRSSEEELRV